MSYKDFIKSLSKRLLNNSKILHTKLNRRDIDKSKHSISKNNTLFYSRQCFKKIKLTSTAIFKFLDIQSRIRSSHEHSQLRHFPAIRPDNWQRSQHGGVAMETEAGVPTRSFRRITGQLETHGIYILDDITSVFEYNHRMTLNHMISHWNESLCGCHGNRYDYKPATRYIRDGYLKNIYIQSIIS